jgi:hypothetical protein
MEHFAKGFVNTIFVVVGNQSIGSLYVGDRYWRSLALG